MKPDFHSLVQAIPGWCSPEKAEAIYEAVRAIGRPIVGVEIGVLAGRSLLPAAMGARDGAGGRIYGIDPYTAAAATEGLDQTGAAWWASVPLEEHRRTCGELIVEYRLQAHCRLRRQTSEEAAPAFDGIDYLHIDGNHSYARVAADGALWVPKVRPAGIIVLDDVDQREVRRATDSIRFGRWDARHKFEIWRRP